VALQLERRNGTLVDVDVSIPTTPLVVGMLPTKGRRREACGWVVAEVVA
jgi:hypothetical protein